MRSNTELIDMSDALIQREIYPLYIMLKEQPLPWRNGAADGVPVVSSERPQGLGLLLEQVGWCHVSKARVATNLVSRIPRGKQ
jgi:hypothetical protein